jgi:hypothetical protein
VESDASRPRGGRVDDRARRNVYSMSGDRPIADLREARLQTASGCLVELRGRPLAFLVGSDEARPLRSERIHSVCIKPVTYRRAATGSAGLAGSGEGLVGTDSFYFGAISMGPPLGSA